MESKPRDATARGQKETKRRLSPAVAGAFAGAFSKTVIAPVERIKLVMQLEPAGGFAIRQNKSAFQTALDIYHRQGLLAFWRGNLPNVVRTAGTAGLNFMLMDFYKEVARRAAKDGLWTSFLSGGLAGGTATTVLYPIEFLRTRLALCFGSKSMRDFLVTTIQSDGIAGLYQGYGIALAGVFLYRGLHLGGYDAMKTLLTDKPNSSASMSWASRFLLAQSVSLAAGTLCYPIDSVRRRLMMQAGKPIEERLYKSSIDCFRVVWATEGAPGFYRGIGPNIVRSVGAALLLVGYDMFQEI